MLWRMNTKNERETKTTLSLYILQHEIEEILFFIRSIIELYYTFHSMCFPVQWYRMNKMLLHKYKLKTI